MPHTFSRYSSIRAVHKLNLNSPNRWTKQTASLEDIVSFYPFTRVPHRLSQVPTGCPLAKFITTCLVGYGISTGAHLANVLVIASNTNVRSVKPSMRSDQKAYQTEHLSLIPRSL